MKKIYKYELLPQELNKFPLPLDCQILSAKEQYGKIVIYALVDPDYIATRHYAFLTFGTGHDILEAISDFTFLDTVKMENGALMFHVFYKKC